MRLGHPKSHVELRHSWYAASETLLLSKPYVPVLIFTLTVSVFCGTAYSADRPGPITPSVAPDSAIVIGFVGGFVHHDDRRHAEVQLAEKLRAQYGSRAHIGIFENHREEDARQSILNWLDSDHSGGGLSDTEKQEARIILYGHSWGASAVVALARELQKDRIPVLLTIQVDSITKPGQDARVIPANVAKAVNFYQTRGIFHGASEIVPADPLHTQILGDIRLEYKRQPEPCSAYPWFARHFMKGHTAIECDPKVWSRIETLISEYLLPPDTKTQTTISRNF
jgi:hypothetical protein